MSIKLIARELYRLKQEVEKLERQVEDAPMGEKAELGDKLRKTRAEKVRLQRMVDGNKEPPEAEQIQVTVQFPDVEQYEMFGAGEGKRLDAVGLVKKFTTRIENFEVGDHAVTNGEELCSQRKHAVAGLVSEIYLYMVRGTELGATREKN